MGVLVALDGPSGTGKSTVARRVAGRLGLRYVDTGATYRAATLAVLRAGADPDDDDAVVAAVEAADVALLTDPDAPGALLGDERVDAEIRGPAVTAAVSAVSAVPRVRELMTALQRRAADEGPGAVAEGRDVGAAVAPEAPVKAWLTADEEVRAARRGEQDATPDRDAVAADLRRRDTADAGRAASPTRQADDAVLVDTTDLGVDEVVEQVLRLAAAAGVRPAGRS